MKKPEQPCKQDCPDRSAECHSTCERWISYERLRNEYYKVKGQTLQAIKIANGIDADRAMRRAKEKRRKK